MRTATQYENAHAYTSTLPERGTFERLEDLFIAWRRSKNTAVRKQLQVESFDRMYSLPEDQAADRRNDIINQRTRAELDVADAELEIVNVARLLIAEADAEVAQ